MSWESDRLGNGQFKFIRKCLPDRVYCRDPAVAQPRLTWGILSLAGSQPRLGSIKVDDTWLFADEVEMFKDVEEGDPLTAFY